MSMVVTTVLGPEAVLAVANTHHGPGGHYRARAAPGDADHDHLADPADAAEFLRLHGVAVPASLPDVGHLEILREIRALARSLPLDGPPAWGARLADLLERARFRIVPPAGLEADAGGWDAVLVNLAPPMLDLIAARDLLKLCGNPQCRFLFLDRSRNRSRVWCEMAVCGNRAKVGRFRYRHEASARP